MFEANYKQINDEYLDYNACYGGSCRKYYPDFCNDSGK